MPSALTMRDAYEKRLKRARGEGNTGLAEEARVGKVWLALFDLVNEDLRAALAEMRDGSEVTAP